MEEKTRGLLLMKNTRNFTEKPSTGSLKSTSKAKEKTVPHYLTSSTGSCHDLCKYGRNPTYGTNEKGSSPPWRSSKGTTFAKKRNPVEVLNVAQRQRNSAGKQKSVEIAKKSGAPKITEEKISNPMRRKSHAVSVIRGSIPLSAKVSKLPEGLKHMKKSPLHGTGSGEISERLSSSSLRKKAETSSKPEETMAKKPSARRSFENLESQDKPQSPLSNLRRPISLVGKFDVSLKPSTPLKSTSEVKRGISAPRISMKSSSAMVFPRRFFPEATKQIDLGESKSKDGILLATSLKKSDEEYIDSTKAKSSSGQSSTSSPHSCLSSSSPSPPSSSSSSSSSSSASSSPSSSPSLSDQDNTSPTACSSVERNLRLSERRTKIDSLNEEEEEARKIRFKAIERVQSDRADSEPETVVLRHQGMQDKRGNMGLFNHVIEETASKLVETRKSKVKALVGAFETVISLQEGKSAD